MRILIRVAGALVSGKSLNAVGTVFAFIVAVAKAHMLSASVRIHLVNAARFFCCVYQANEC